MSMLDSFFSKGFKGTKCKTLLKLTIPRIKLLRNRREAQIKQMRKDIAKLLETGQEATARIRVEHIVREENMMAAQEIIELFCELVAVRLPIIESQRECPLDLKEAIASICFAAPRCADLSELLQVQMEFASKYGKEFVAATTELRPDCGVNRQLIELLSVRAPSPEKKMRLLKEIAEENDLDWDPAPSEAELFKSHEDLLNGPTQFIGGSKLPVPKEMHHEVPQFQAVQGAVERSDSEENFDELEFPEVPNVSLRPGADADAEVASSQPLHPEPHHASATHSYSEEKSFDQCTDNHEENLHAANSEMPEPSANLGAGKQFLPFICPPSPSLATPPPSLSPAAPPPSLSPAAPPPSLSPAAPPPSLSPAAPPPSMLRAAPPVRENQSLNLPRTRSDATFDFNDVLAAAKAAAESAERAAAAARSAASLAELRISEHSKSSRGQSPDKDSENPFYATNDNPSAAMENVKSDETLAGESDNLNPSSRDEYFQNNQTESETTTVGVVHQNSSPPAEDSAKEELAYHQPQKLPSMDDDYFSYPNLFNPQSGNTAPSTQSPDNQQPRHGL